MLRPKRGHVLVHREHLGGPGRRTGQRFQGARTERIDARCPRPQVKGQVAHRRLQRRFADSHHVVPGHALLAAEIRHRQNRRTRTQVRQGAMSHGDQAVDADIHRQLETVPAGLDRIPAQILAIGKSNRMQQEIDLVELLVRRPHDIRDLPVALRIQGQEELGLRILRHDTERRGADFSSFLHRASRAST